MRTLHATVTVMAAKGADFALCSRDQVRTGAPAPLQAHLSDTTTGAKERARELDAT